VLPRGPVGGGQDALLFFFEQRGIGCVAAIQVEKQFKDVRVSNNLVIAVRLAGTVPCAICAEYDVFAHGPSPEWTVFPTAIISQFGTLAAAIFCVTRQTQ
jgi:hypothetical protein